MLLAINYDVAVVDQQAMGCASAAAPDADAVEARVVAEVSLPSLSRAVVKDRRSLLVTVWWWL